MQPRIYVYKITFVGQPYWYWGWHKEKKYDEYYMGSPKTNKSYWDIYEPIKKIVQVFEYSEEGALLAQKAEQALIKSDLENPSCLNENCGGVVSLKVRSEGSKKSWKDLKRREKASESMTSTMLRLWRDPDYKEKVSSEVRERWRDPDYKERSSKGISVASKERWRDPDYKNKVSQSISAGLTEKWKDPDFKQKMSDSNKGSKNPQFGSMWITDGTKEGSKMIKRGEEIPEGFRLGRVCK